MADAGDVGQRCQPVPRGLLSGREEPQLAAELASAPSAAKVGVAARLSWYVSAVTQDPDGPRSGAGTPPRCANQGVHRRDPNEQRRGLWAPEPGRIPRLITALTLGGMGAQGPPAGPVRRGQHCAGKRERALTTCLSVSKT